MLKKHSNKIGELRHSQTDPCPDPKNESAVWMWHMVRYV